jgi:hypothetical protein
MDSAFWLLEDRLSVQSPETQVKLLGCSKELAMLAQRSKAPPPVSIRSHHITTSHSIVSMTFRP